MLGKIKQPNAKLKLNVVACVILDEMIDIGPNSPEYPALLQSLKQVNEIEETKSKTKLDPNTILQVAASLLGVVAIVAYEQKHVLTTKALSLVKFR